MSEPKPIAVYMSSELPSFRSGFYKFDQEKSSNDTEAYLYENGEPTASNSSRSTFHISKYTGLNNEGPVHPDDWYWNEDEKRLKEMSTLSEEEYLEVSMSDALRITISEWDEIAYSKALIAARQAYEKRAWEIAFQRHQLDKEAQALGTPRRQHRA